MSAVMNKIRNGDSEMTFHRKLRRLVVIGVAAAAVAAPAATATPEKYVQIGGDLVAPTQLSAYQAHADVRLAPPLVQIGGELVRPDRVSAFQAHASQLAAPRSSSDDQGFGWTTTGIGIGLAGVLLAAGGALGVQWRRGRLGMA
jgi:hypothetical protein